MNHAEAIIKWLRWMSIGGHPDQINPDERYAQAADTIDALQNRVAALELECRAAKERMWETGQENSALRARIATYDNRDRSRPREA